MSNYTNLEEKIKNTASEIYSSIKGEVPPVFDRKRWMGELMEWAMKNDNFKVQLLRFVDVLPSLKTDALVVRLLKEYFTGTDIAPMIVKWGIKGVSEKGILPKIAGKIIRSNIESMARQFIAGKDPEDALDILYELRRDGCPFIVDLLGEVVVSDREAMEYMDRYMKLLDFLHPKVMGWEENPLLDRDSSGPVPRLNISLKISSFYSQLDPLDWTGSVERTKEGLRPVLIKAGELGASVTFDMEDYYHKDLTIAVFKNVMEEFNDFPFAGIALQTYLKDTKDDLLEIIKWAEERKRPITIRLVKGAYWDYEMVINRQKGWPVPVFLNKEETDHSFEELTRLMLENTGYIRPAFATHNIRSISNAIAAADSLNLPVDSFEFQMLHGMAEPIRRALQKLRYRISVYTPVGELIPGMAYLVRRLLENTSNESFLRKSFVENKTFEELIKAPQPQEDSAVKENDDKVFRNEPLTDFSKAENRDKFKDTLEKTRKKFGNKYPLCIGSKEIRKDKEIISLNPSNPDEIVGMVSSADREDADMAIADAVKAWSSWKKTSYEERAEYLFRAAKEIRNRKFELAALEVFEAGKSWRESDADVAEAIDFLEYYAREMIRLGPPQRLSRYPGEHNEYVYEPRGTGVVISPWNFPLAIPAGMVSAGIVTGNCILFKPSGLAPVMGWMLVEVFRAAGLPPGVLQFLPGPGEDVGEYLVSHPLTDFIAFTGSKDVGLGIVKHSGEVSTGQKNVKKVVAEMGGKNAIIIDETADLDESVKGVVESSLGYQGQKCSACSRVIVIGGIYNKFCERLRDAMESIKVGAAEDPSSFMGPVVDKGALKKINNYINLGKKEENLLVFRETEGTGYFVGPVVFADVKPDSVIAHDEIFGPVLTVIKAENIDEAVKIANNTEYALTGGIFSRSPANIRLVKDELNAGNLYINRGITGALVGRQPFGGFGMSGVGSKAGGPDYLLQFMNPRCISEKTLRRGFAPEEK